MCGWNDLPVNSKKEVIKRLDLMSRTAMRCTSRAHREIVDATEFYVPRVRFSSYLTDCMVMIYTGIEKFLRIEVETLKEGVKVHRMENTYNRAEATTRVIPSIGSFTLCYKIMKALFLHESILLGALEIEFAFPKICVTQQMTVVFMKRSLGDRLFRTKKLVTNCQTDCKTELMLYRNMCDPEVLEEMTNDGIRLATQELESRKILDVTTLPQKGEKDMTIKEGEDFPVENFIDVPAYDTHIWLDAMRLHAPQLLANRARNTEGFATIRFGLFPDEPDLWDYQAHPIKRLNDHVQLKRTVDPNLDIVVRWNKSSCGTWVHMMKTSNERKFLNYFKNEKCGLRWLCRKCTDPFEQWFYKELPRRVFYEPDYNHLALGFATEDREVADVKVKELVTKMRAQYAEDDKKRGKKKTSAESWGFKKSNSPKRAPPKFIRGKDYDDLNGLLSAGKVLDVRMSNFEILRSEWVAQRSGENSSGVVISDDQGFFHKAGKMIGNFFSFGNTAEPPKPAPRPSLSKVMKDYSLKDFLESTGITMMRVPDGEEGEQMLEAYEKKWEAMRKLKVEQAQKSIDSAHPLEGMIRKFLENKNESEASVEELKSRAEKRTEKNKKKKEKKKVKKAQQAGEQMEAWNMV